MIPRRDGPPAAFTTRLRNEVATAVGTFQAEGSWRLMEALVRDGVPQGGAAAHCLEAIARTAGTPIPSHFKHAHDFEYTRPMAAAWIAAMHGNQAQLDEAFATFAMEDQPVRLEMTRMVREGGADWRSLLRGTTGSRCSELLKFGAEHMDRMLGAILPPTLDETPRLELPSVAHGQPPYRRPLLLLLAECPVQQPQVLEAGVVAGRMILERSTPAAREDAEFILRVELKQPVPNVWTVNHLLRMGVSAARLQRELTEDLYPTTADASSTRHTMVAKLAGEAGAEEAIAAMHEAGLPLDLPNCNVHGHRPLHFAVQALNLPAIDALLVAGADPGGRPAGSGNTALEEAERLRDVGGGTPNQNRERDALVDRLRAASARKAAQRAIAGTPGRQP